MEKSKEIYLDLDIPDLKFQPVILKMCAVHIISS